MSETAPLSPIAHRAALPAGSARTIAMSNVTDRAMIDLRVRSDDAAAVKSLEAALGMTLPHEPRSSTLSGERQALWLSIDQWLITAPLTDRAGLTASLDAAAAGQFAAITDMSDARAVIRLEGAGARETVMKGAAADLTRSDVGTVRRMMFADIAAMAHVISDDPDAIDIYVFRSYAEYAWDWLEAASRPAASIRLFGAQPVPAT